MKTAITLGALLIIIVSGGFFYMQTEKNQSLQSDMRAEKQMMEKSAASDKAMSDKNITTNDSMTNKNVMMDSKKWTPEEMEKMKMMEKKTDTGEIMKKDSMTMSAGSYEAYAPEKIATASLHGKVVLFFRASWCPTCRGLDADIRNHVNEIPKDITILDVNYDDSAALKQMYGVTYQHTFVEVDGKGALIKKWSGSPTLSVLLSEVK
jgi:thiol-disulfide isomerase/thioredoxin